MLYQLSYPDTHISDGVAPKHQRERERESRFSKIGASEIMNPYGTCCANSQLMGSSGDSVHHQRNYLVCLYSRWFDCRCYQLLFIFYFWNLLHCLCLSWTFTFSVNRKQLSNSTEPVHTISCSTSLRSSWSAMVSYIRSLEVESSHCNFQFTSDPFN